MHDVIVVGGGPGGLSAAIFLARAGRRTLLVDGGSSSVDRAFLRNYLGFPDGILGSELRALGLRQAERAGVEVRPGRVTAVRRIEGGFRLETEDGAFEGRHLLLTTGRNADLAGSLGAAVTTWREPKGGPVFQVDADGRTTVPGVWAAGVAAGTTSHAIVAAGDGARVAINLLSELAGRRHIDHEKPPAAGA